MRVRQERVFRIPFEELRSMLASQYGVNLGDVEPYLDKDSVVFAVGLDDSVDARLDTVKFRTQSDVAERKRSRRSRRRRNRVKTRGWKVLAKIVNSKGLLANVYEPFVLALKNSQVSRSEQKKIVRQIILQNGNNPTDESVEYFLTNTLEYLDKELRGGIING
jgi:hypothetical protein